MAHMHHMSNLLKSRIALCEEQADIEVVSKKLFLIRELFAETKYERVFWSYLKHFNEHCSNFGGKLELSIDSSHSVCSIRSGI